MEILKCRMDRSPNNFAFSIIHFPILISYSLTLYSPPPTIAARFQVECESILAAQIPTTQLLSDVFLRDEMARA